MFTAHTTRALATVAVLFTLLVGSVLVAPSARAATDADRLDLIETKLDLIKGVVAVMAQAYRIPSVQSLVQAVSSVPPLEPPSCTIKVSRSAITLGEAYTVRWTSMNATSISGKGIDADELNGSMKVVPSLSGTHKLSMTVSGPGGTGRCTSSVIVNAKQTTSASISVRATEVKANAEVSGTSDDYILDATIEFEVTASGEDIYIPKTAVRGSSKSAGLTFRMHDAGIPANAVEDGTAKVAFSALNADQENGYYIVHDGDTEQFDINVWYTPDTPVAVGLTLLTLNWNTAPATPNKSTSLAPRADFMTDALIIPPIDPVGTYVGYLGGKQFIKTKNISKSSALENCKENATNNPGQSIRCTWNGKEIYSASASASYGIKDVKSVTARYVDPIPNAADDEYTEYTITLKSGVVHTVKQYGFALPGAFEKALRATGYTGRVDKLTDMASSVATTGKFKDAIGVGAYEGTYPKGVSHSYGKHPQGAITVSVPAYPGSGSKEVVLVLSAYEPVKWSITGSGKRDIGRVLVVGYHKQKVTGLASSIPIDSFTYEGGQGDTIDQYAKGSEDPSALLDALDEYVESHYGVPIQQFIKGYSLDKAVFTGWKG